MFDVVVFEGGEPEWCVNLAPLSEERAAECLAAATAEGAFWRGRDVRIVSAEG
jgi:hypothetical protein